MPAAEVRCASISYFEEVPSTSATGEAIVSGSGKPVVVQARREALMGDVVELTEHEYARLEQLDAVQAPGSALLPGQGLTASTPFSVPAPNPDAPAVPEAGALVAPVTVTAETATSITTLVSSGATVNEILGAVGGSADLALHAAAAEQDRPEPRSTLLDKLAAIHG